MRSTSICEQVSTDSGRLDLDGENLQKGLAKLVLTIVELLRDLLERQALRRVKSGALSRREVERLGLAFIQISQRIAEICLEFGLRPEELDLDLGPLGPLRSQDSRQVSLVDVVDRLIDQGTIIAGEVLVSVAGVDLITLDLLLMLSSVHRLESVCKSYRGEVQKND